MNLYIEAVARSFERDRIRETRAVEQYAALAQPGPAESLRSRIARALVRAGFELDPAAAATVALRPAATSAN